MCPTRIFSQESRSEHSLTPTIDVTSATHKVIAQVNQSDLAFLRERARSIDAEIWMKDKTLNVKTRANRRGEKVSLKYKAELREFCVLADLANQRTSVVAAGWDVSAKEAIKKEASESVISERTRKRYERHRHFENCVRRAKGITRSHGSARQSGSAVGSGKFYENNCPAIRRRTRNRRTKREIARRRVRRTRRVGKTYSTANITWRKSLIFLTA